MKKILYFCLFLDIIVIQTEGLVYVMHCITALKGRIVMVRTIRLTPDEVQNFVNVTSKCDFDIDICYNRYVVDAKSFLGVYGLDFKKPLTVSYDGYDSALEELLNSHAIAC